ncbi:MAG: tetratricopeptide repeat protein [Planctomycetes bacterium]|nr:tetratricopeptide repeat protein [Planctomycetota bacterium]
MSQSSSSRLLVVLFTDVVGSTDLKSKLGANAYGALAARHDQIFRALVDAIPGAEILKDLGDGFMAIFERASQAVQVALLFQHALCDPSWGETRLRVRIGLHLGEVSELGLDVSGKQKIVGLAADLAARLCGLALADQILLSRGAFDDARQYLREHPARNAAGEQPKLAWIAHGPYLLKGAEEPLDIFEVGAVGEAALRTPPDSEKARRAVRAGEEETLGWRPASGLAIPHRAGWRLERELGRGGFGEVWLGVHERTQETRVFKFCFDAERLRSFRRELMLFRVLRDALGDRPDIARLLEVQLEKAPYYLESEFCSSGNLAEWAAGEGQLASLPLGERLELLCRIADALHAAHSVGVLHKDVKPANVLLYRTSEGELRPRLADFGIGVLTDRSRLSPGVSGASSATVEQLVSNDSERTGTHFYAPPETLRGQPFRVQGDVYALGVMLYQLAIGDFERPLAQGWEREIADPLLRADIAKAVAGNAEERFASAAALAENLRSLPRRRTAHRRARILRVAAGSSLALVFVIGATAFAWSHERDLRRDAEVARATALAEKERADRERVQAEEARATALAEKERADRERAMAEESRATALAEKERADRERAKAEQSARDAQETLVFLQRTISKVHPTLGSGPEVKMKDVLEMAVDDLEQALPASAEVQASIRNTLGEAFAVVADHERALEQIGRAYELRKETLGAEHPETLMAQNNLATLAVTLGLPEADALVTEVLETRERVLGPEAPETLATKITLAYLLRSKEDGAASEALYREVLEARRRTLGESHRETLEAASSLADFLQDRGRLAEAEVLIRETIERSDASFGESDTQSVISRSILASILKDLGRYEEAEPIARAVVAALVRFNGDDHGETMAAKNVLALLLERLQRAQEARELLRATWESSLRVFGADHGGTLIYQDNLARQEQLCGNLDEAERLMTDSLERQERLYAGQKRQDTLIALNNLALLKLDRKKPAEALLLFQRCGEGLKEVLPPDHWMHSAARKNMGDAYLDLQQIDDAEKCFLEAERGLSAILGPQHDRTRGAMLSLIDIYERKKMPEEKARWQKKFAGG